MNHAHPRPAAAPGKARFGFTLTEIVLTMAIIASALMAVLAVVPAGMDVSRNATDHSVVATIQEDLYHRLQGEPLKEGTASFSPAFFDDLGVLIPSTTSSTELEARRVYRADIVIRKWATAPSYTNADKFKAATIAISWPLNGSGVAPNSAPPRIITTFAVSTSSGPDWEKIDSAYEPKIGQ